MLTMCVGEREKMRRQNKQYHIQRSQKINIARSTTQTGLCITSYGSHKMSISNEDNDL